MKRYSSPLLAARAKQSSVRHRSSGRGRSAYVSSPASRQPIVTEALEGRTLMAAFHNLDASAMLGRFQNSHRLPSQSAPAAAGPRLPVSTSGDPNDTIAGAERFSLNFTELGHLKYAMDIDIHRFPVKAGQRVHFDIDAVPGKTVDTVIRLFDAAGREMARNDNGAAPGEAASLDSFIDYTFDSSNFYFLAVSGVGNDDYNPVTGASDHLSQERGDYLLRATKVAAAPADGNDQLSEARALAAGGTTTGTIGTGNDVDVYRVTVAAGQTLSFDVASTGGPGLPGSHLRLFTAAGRQLSTTGTSIAQPLASGAAGGASHLQHTFATGGTYYVAVSGAGNAAYNPVTGLGDVVGATGRYSLRSQVR